MPLRLLPATAVALLLAAVAALAGSSAPALAASRSEFAAAPNWPNSMLAISVQGRPRAGGIATVVVSGYNDPIDTADFDVDLFVQNPRVLRTCPRSYDAARNNLINLSDQVSHIGRSLDAGNGGRFRIPVKYRTGGLRRVMFCAYTLFIIDDVAVSALRHTLARPVPRGRR